jgi:hypothetical protein
MVRVASAKIKSQFRIGVIGAADRLRPAQACDVPTVIAQPATAARPNSLITDEISVPDRSHEAGLQFGHAVLPGTPHACTSPAALSAGARASALQPAGLVFEAVDPL